jgi:hypothetical protein
MDISAVAQGMADAVSGLVSDGEVLTGFRYMPDSVPVPAFVQGDVEIDFDRTFGRGMDELVFRPVLLVGRADDMAAQDRLNAFLSGGGPSALKAALEADGTLGGVCDDLHVRRVTGRRQYTVGEATYVGAELEILVIGTGD